MTSREPLAYDADNRLSTWSGSATTFDEDGNMTSGPLAASTGTAFGATTYYVYGYGLLYEETGANTKTCHTNQVGSTLAITDGTQSVTDWIEYAPFGTITYRSGSTDTPFLFNGEAGVQTEASGLYYMRARYYHARLMRFVNADPIGFSGGLNWYAFGGNNPISFADPSGLEKQDRANSTGQAQWDSERGLYVMPSVSAVAPGNSARASGAVPAAYDPIGRIFRGLRREGTVRDPNSDEMNQINEVMSALGQSTSSLAQEYKISIESKRILVFTDAYAPVENGQRTWGLTHPSVTQKIILLNQENFLNTNARLTAPDGSTWNYSMGKTLVHEDTHIKYYLLGKPDNNEEDLPGVHRDFPAIWDALVPTISK